MGNTIKTAIIDRLTPEIIEDMKHIHFCADLHAHHPKIVDICNRPVFVLEKDAEGIIKEERIIQNPRYRQILDRIHNDWLIKDVFNAYVGKKDTVYILGDVSLAKRSDAEKFIDRLNGRKFLILGNHDRNIDTSTRFEQITQIKDFTYSKFGLNIHIVLCHYAMLSWNRKVHRSFHLYGHSHGRLQQNDNLSYDVGIDNRLGIAGISSWCKPLNLYEICLIMAEKEKGIIYLGDGEGDLD